MIDSRERAKIADELNTKIVFLENAVAHLASKYYGMVSELKMTKFIYNRLVNGEIIIDDTGAYRETKLNTVFLRPSVDPDSLGVIDRERYFETHLRSL